MDNYLFLPRAIAATLSDVSFAAVTGIALVDLWLASPSEHRLRSAAILNLIALLIALVAQAYLTTATMVGAADLHSVRAQLVDVLTTTHAGRVLIIQAAVALLLVATLSLCKRITTLLIFALLLLLAATRAASGHAASNGDFTLAELVQFLHLASTAIWSGCVIAAGLLVLPTLVPGAGHESTLHLMRRLSKTVTIALVIIMLSGAYNAYLGLGGSLSPLLHTQWGALLVIKLILIAAAITLGALNRRTIHPKAEPSAATLARLVRTMRVEAIFMLLILAVSAFLANSPPANPA